MKACLIEDDAIVVLLTKKFLEKTGSVESVLTYNNGKDAFEDLKNRYETDMELPEIIFLDLNMPIWDGWVFLDEFIKLPFCKDIKIYILTSSSSQSDRDKAKKYGLAENFLQKPLSYKKLHKLVS